VNDLSVGPARDHGALMDRMYRGQRHIYDLTRKYYLFGRDRLVAELACERGTTVLEVACGTGRNLAMVARHWPGAELYGVDISREMLRSAKVKLGNRARLAAGDACRLDTASTLGRARFDRVILSYCLSMIPDYRAALEQGTALLAPGGSLHVVDFGDGGGMPRPLARALQSWLGQFHVTPREDLRDVAVAVASRGGLRVTYRHGPLRYYQALTLTAPP
jgi:S-adenosylmethionine-diacylgycerolhomoserine-N-methlytransferase